MLICTVPLTGAKLESLDDLSRRHDNGWSHTRCRFVEQPSRSSLGFQKNSFSSRPCSSRPRNDPGSIASPSNFWNRYFNTYLNKTSQPSQKPAEPFTKSPIQRSLKTSDLHGTTRPQKFQRYAHSSPQFLKRSSTGEASEEPRSTSEEFLSWNIRRDSRTRNSRQ